MYRARTICLAVAAALALPGAAHASGFTLAPYPSALRAPIVTNTKLGAGVYGPASLDALAKMRPAAFLIQDPDPRAAATLRAVFPRAFIVGRQFVADGDPSLANCQDSTEPHQAKGADFGQMIARMAVPLKGIVDAWLADNEQSSSADRGSLACHAQFDQGVIDRLQERYSIPVVIGNDASGAVDPQDYVKYFAQPISQAAYFGLHAYGKPGASSLQTPDSLYYTLRYRLVHDALVQAGVPLPKGGFVLTETGLYDGLRPGVTHQGLGTDLLWLEQQIEQDDYVRAQMVFGFGVGPHNRAFELQSTGVPDMLGTYNAQHPGP